MRDDQLKNFAGIMLEYGLTGLEFDENGNIRRIERNPSVTTVTMQGQPQEAAPAAAPAGPGEMHASQQISAGISSKNIKEVKSPMVGIFYDCPTEDELPYVQQGDTVRKGDVLCIIEAMKLMNEIVAEYDGVVEEICAENRNPVEFGQVLFRIREE